MMASNWHITEQMRLVDLTLYITNQGGSIGYALPAPQGKASIPQGPPLLQSKVVVPSSSKRLRQILGYYNQSNHFNIFKPTWATNVSGVRFIWIELGCPMPPKSATEIGRSARRTKKNFENDKKYKVRSYININFNNVS
jgi:hypothetical protein